MTAPTAALRVDDLVRSPALQLRVLAGEDGLHRPVSWAHVSELEDPTPWLLGAELIMTTGIAVPRPAVRRRARRATRRRGRVHARPLRMPACAAAASGVRGDGGRTVPARTGVALAGALHCRGAGGGRRPAGRRPAEVGQAGLGVVQHIATVAALQVSMVRHERETLRRNGAEMLAELLQDVLDPDTARRHLTRLGFAADTAVLLAVLDGADDGPLDEPRWFSPWTTRPYRTSCCAGMRACTYSSRTPRTPASPSRQYRAPGWLSRPFAPGGTLGLARREAVLALRRAGTSGESMVVFSDDMTERRLHDDPSVLHGLVDQVLGAALRYDAEHGRALVLSALTWLERDRSTEEAAHALHIHPNTLLYRLRHFAAVSGKTLSATADLTEVWLALQAAHLCTDSPDARLRRAPRTHAHRPNTPLRRLCRRLKDAMQSTWCVASNIRP